MKACCAYRRVFIESNTTSIIVVGCIFVTLTVCIRLPLSAAR
jgi:hypothetical protein